jgi:hypothetical protein
LKYFLSALSMSSTLFTTFSLKYSLKASWHTLVFSSYTLKVEYSRLIDFNSISLHSSYIVNFNVSAVKKLCSMIRLYSHNSKSQIETNK